MDFKSYTDGRSLSSKDFRAFLHKHNIIDGDKVEFRPLELLLIMPPESSSSGDAIDEFHKTYFDWNPNLRAIKLQSNSETDIGTNLPKSIVTFFPQICNPLFRGFFLMNKSRLLIELLMISILFAAIVFFLGFFKSKASFTLYVSNLDWNNFIFESIFQNISYWAPMTVCFLILTFYGMRSKDGQDEMINNIIKTLSQNGYNELTRRMLKMASNYPFVLYIDALEDLMARDREILFNHVLKSEALINAQIQYYVVVFSRAPCEARMHFMSMNDGDDLHIFEATSYYHTKKESESYSGVSETVRLFYESNHQGDPVDDIWTFFETFYVYGIVCQLIGGRSIDKFRDDMEGFVKACRGNPDYLLHKLSDLPEVKRFKSAITNVVSDFNLQREEFLGKLMIYRPRRHYMDGYTINALRNQICPRLRTAANLFMLDYLLYYFHAAEYYTRTISDSSHLISFLVEPVIKAMVSGESEPPAEYISAVSHLCKQYMDIYEERGCDDFSVDISMLLLICADKQKLDISDNIHLKALHNIFVFERINSQKFSMFKKSINPDTSLGKFFKVATSYNTPDIREDHGVSIKSLINRGAGQSVENFIHWLSIKDIEDSGLLPILPIRLFEPDHNFKQLIDTDNKTYKIKRLETGGGLNFATWVSIFQLQLFLAQSKISDVFKIFGTISRNIEIIRKNVPELSLINIWIISVQLIMLVEVLDAFFMLNRGKRIPELFKRQHRGVLELAFENVDIQYPDMNNGNIPQEILTLVLQRLSKCKLVYELREMPLFSSIIELYRSKMLYLLYRCDSKLFFKRSSRDNQTGIEDSIHKSYLFLSHIVEQEEFRYAIWPNFIDQCLVVLACIESTIHIELSLITLDRFFKMLSMNLNIDSENLHRAKSWFFHKIRLYGSEHNRFFENYLKDLCQSHIKRLKSIDDEPDKENIILDAIAISPSLSRAGMKSESRELKQLIDHVIERISTGQLDLKRGDHDEEIDVYYLLSTFERCKAEKRLDTADIGDKNYYCQKILNDWIVFSDGDDGVRPNSPLEELLNDKNFAYNDNYGVAIQLYIYHNGINDNLVEYLEIYARQPLSGFRSMVWCSISHILARKLSSDSDKCEKDMRIVNQIIDLLIQIAEKIWLNYINLPSYLSTMHYFYYLFAKRINTNVTERNFVQSSYQNFHAQSLIKNIQLHQLRKTRYENIKKTITVNEYRTICLEIYQIFHSYLRLSKPTREILVRWNEIKDDDLVSLAELKEMSLDYSFKILAQGKEAAYEVIPILQRVENSCTSKKCNGQDKKYIKSCEDLWNLLGNVILQDLFSNLSEKREMGNAVLKELGQFYDFISEGSPMISPDQDIKAQIKSLRKELASQPG